MLREDGTMLPVNFADLIASAGLDNGDMDLCQRFGVLGSTTIAAASSKWVLDRWLVTNGTNQTVTVSQQRFTAGQGLVPGSPRYKMHLAFSVAPTTGTLRIAQRMERADTWEGKLCTAAAYLTGPTGAETLSCEVVQCFGTGGAPSGNVTTAFTAGSLNYATIYSAIEQRRHCLVTPPSTSGKTYGTDNAGESDYLELAWVLTPRQTGNYEFAHASFGPGDRRSRQDTLLRLPSPIRVQRAQKFYSKNYDLEVAPGTNLGSGFETAGLSAVTINTTDTGSPGPFPQPMRRVPDVVLYAYDGTANAVRNHASASIITGLTLVGTTRTSLGRIDKSGALPSAGNMIGCLFTADAEFT